MSPGAALDKLWHFMLLNTDISSTVHAVVGGIVRHIGTDEDDLDDATKRLQRLYALNIMAREGWQPDVRLWADPGTNMSFIFPAMQPDGTPLYVCSGLTQAETAALKADLARVFSSNSDSSRVAEATAAADKQPHFETVGDGECEAGSPQQAEPQPSFISILNVADGRMFDLQLPEELAATGVAVSDVKMAMATKLAQPASQLRLAVINYGSNNLGLKILSDSEVVQKRDLVRVLLPSAKLPRPPSTPYGVVVKTLTGKSIQLAGKVAPWFLVYELKLVIEATDGFPPDQQRIIYSGRQLEDGNSLKHYNIAHQSTIHMVLRLCGC